MYRHYFKRFLDFCIALLVLIIISPILLIVTIWLLFANKGAGAFFMQTRIGKDCRVFKMLKFKSMTDERDDSGHLLPDSMRLTKAGRFVRLTSIDELPQLINVLKGEMSFIGPRPLYVRYLPYYTEEENQRHKVRPGITGLAQVHGRKSITWSEKLKLDVKYVDEYCLRMDLRIIWMTIVNVLKHEDVGLETSGTNDFNDYREREWLNNGRQDLIKIAREKVKLLS